MSEQTSLLDSILAATVRLAGLITLFSGLYIGLNVIFEAWHIYQQPQRVERIATAIEQGSQLDALLASFTYRNVISDDSNDEIETPIESKSAEKPHISM